MILMAGRNDMPKDESKNGKTVKAPTTLPAPNKETGLSTEARDQSSKRPSDGRGESSSSISSKNNNVAQNQAGDENDSCSTDLPEGMLSVLPRNYEPSPYDVICGRGKQARDHPGNIQFRKYVL